jgi:hypothetical protein
MDSGCVLSKKALQDSPQAKNKLIIKYGQSQSGY